MKKKLTILFLLSLIFFINPVSAQVAKNITIEWRWKINIGPNTTNTDEPIWYNQPAYAVCQNGILYASYGKEFIAIDSSNGKILYKLKPAFKKVFYKFTTDANYIYIIECPIDYDKMSKDGGSLLKLEQKTGVEIWRINDLIIPFVDIYSLDNKLILVYKNIGAATYLSKDTGEQVECCISIVGEKNKCGVLVDVYPCLFEEKYIISVVSSASTDIAELYIFDILTKDEKSMLFKTGAPKGVDLEILLVDNENILIKSFDARYHSPWGNSGDILCINWKKNSKVWSLPYDANEEIKLVFSTPENPTVYYAINFNGYLSLIDRITGIKSKESNILSDLDIKNISQPAIWQNYLLIRDANNLLILDLKEENAVFSFRERPLDQKPSSFSVIDIGLITPLSPLIFQSNNNTSEIIVIFPLSENIYSLKMRDQKKTKLTKGGALCD